MRADSLIIYCHGWLSRRPPPRFPNPQKESRFRDYRDPHLALGIGANSAIFNVVNALLLSSLPVRHPERLLLISTLDSKNAEHGFSLPAFEELLRRADSFSDAQSATYEALPV